jgi:hypothetical protein
MGNAAGVIFGSRPLCFADWCCAASPSARRIFADPLSVNIERGKNAGGR